ncbi:MAG: hypothetical protein ACE5IR_18335 [bacterium]
MKTKQAYKIIHDPKVKQLIRDQIEGYKEMNEFVQDEQRKNLPKMTPEESKAIYEELWQVWENSQKQNPLDMRQMDRLRIKALIHRRRLFDKIAAGLRKDGKSI